jgi:3-oxoacyl-[acyl-carrier-protein] synthase II
MSDRRRVVVSGMGAVCASGIGAEAFWRACVAGESGLRPIRAFDATRFGADRGGEVLLLDAPGPERASSFALAASRQALDGAGLEAAPSGAGLVLGTCLGGATVTFDWLAGRNDGGVRRTGWLTGPTIFLAEHLGLTGPVSTVSSACASGAGAVILAADCVRRGEADVMLAGGTESLSSFVVSGFSELRALSSGPVRPFDRRRDGLALGEGGAILVLEEREHARARGAPILGEVLGAARSADANHMTGPSRTGDGVVRAVAAALRDAGISSDRVDFISAHGTGTPFNDRMETIAFKRIFGERAFRIPVNSVKPVVGHTLGAAGALEVILCIRVMAESVVPPTINYEEPDPECDLDYVPNVARAREVRCALSCSSAFGGNNAAILLGTP